jgi:hypothetical protein
VPDEETGPGVYGITVIASDASLSATATIPVTVTEVNEAPVFGALPATMVDEGTTLEARFVVSDVDLPAQSFTFGLVSSPSGASIDPATGVLRWTPGEDDGPGEHQATVLASDGVVTTSQRVTLTVNEVNLAPALEPIAEVTVIASDTVAFTATAIDPDVPVQSLTYSLSDAPDGASIDPNSGQFSWVSSAAGLYAATVIVSDGVLTDSFSVPIVVKPGSTAPAFFPFADQTVLEEMTVLFAVQAYDVNGDVITYSLDNAPNGAIISPTTGLVTWPTDENDGDRAYTATVIASDGALTSSQVITINVLEVNQPPGIIPIAEQSVIVGEMISFTIVPTDTDVPTQTLTLGLSYAPSGATFNPDTGLFNWLTSVLGVHSTTITVSDGVITTSGTIILTVHAHGYSIALHTVGQGNVSRAPTQTIYPPGTVVTLTATADPDWAFTNWSGDATGITNPLALTMDADKVITATFTLVTTEYSVYLPLVMRE